ncbi:MAG: zf-HC2 domain-containing protein [Gemmatimonadaceae bacterium]
MTDCSNAEIRDLLPDYVHDQLSVADLARVEQHLVSCADCAEELELLQTVLAIRPTVKAANIADIVASLPKPGVHAAITVHGASDESDNTGVRSIASARSVVRKTSAFRDWRAAAAIAVITFGGLSVAISRQALMSATDATPLSDTTGMGVAVLNSAPASLSNANDSAAAVSDSRVSLSVGDLSDYSDEELQAMMARLDKWDGSASAEPLPGVPILPPGS